MTKIEGSGSISQRHGAADPDPHQNVMDSETDEQFFSSNSSVLPLVVHVLVDPLGPDPRVAGRGVGVPAAGCGGSDGWRAGGQGLSQLRHRLGLLITALARRSGQ
jgi:hypothetical protein